MATLTRIRFGYRQTKYVHFLPKQTLNFRQLQRVLFHCTPSLDVKGQEIKMPSLSPTMAEGTIVKWMKKEGDQIQPGDVLCDIQTDKAVISMETEEEGVLAKIIIPENTSEIKVGTLIALMVGDGEDWKSVEVPSGASESVSSSSETSAPSSESSGGAPAISGPPTVEVNMPALSPTMTEGTIVKWLKKEGDSIAPGDALCDIQTDKAVMTMETEEEGVLAKILVPDDTKDVKIGTLIALIVAEGEDWKSVVVSSTPAKSSVAPQQVAASASPAAPRPSGPKSAESTIGPAVRSLLEMYQIERSAIKGTGRKNMLLKSDVLQYIKENRIEKKAPKPVPLPAAVSTAKTTKAGKTLEPIGRLTKPGQNYVDIELSNMRRVIAQRLTQSKKDIPHSYSAIQCNVDKLLKMRKNLQQENIKVSVNDFVIKTAAAALERCPAVNAHYLGAPQQVKEVDIAVAVATDNGLITPIVKDANHKGIVDISQNVKDLAGKARSGKLKPHEFQGGSFTISNLGMFGINYFTAIINPPQCAILAVGGGIQRVGEDLKPQTDIKVTLSFDRRAIDEEQAAEFLQVFKELLEDPQRLILGKTPSQRANEDAGL